MDIEQLKKDYLEMLEIEMDTYDDWQEFARQRTEIGEKLKKLGVDPNTLD